MDYQYVYAKNVFLHFLTVDPLLNTTHAHLHAYRNVKKLPTC